MDELRKKHTVQIFYNNVLIKGIVVDFSDDRVLIKIDDDFLSVAKEIKELDEVEVDVDTHMGVKKMKSSVISELNSKNCIVIENNPSYSVVQKRESVRVSCSINFLIIKDEKMIIAKCDNISAGGLAFKINEGQFKIGDIINIKFFEKDFGKNITCQASIVKIEDDIYAAKFLNLNMYDENKIVKRIFELIASK